MPRWAVRSIDGVEGGRCTARWGRGSEKAPTRHRPSNSTPVAERTRTGSTKCATSVSNVWRSQWRGRQIRTGAGRVEAAGVSGVAGWSDGAEFQIVAHAQRAGRQVRGKPMRAIPDSLAPTVMERGQAALRGPIERASYPKQGGDHGRLCIPRPAIGSPRRFWPSIPVVYARRRRQPLRPCISTAGIYSSNSERERGDDYARPPASKSGSADCVITSSLFLIYKTIPPRHTSPSLTAPSSSSLPSSPPSPDTQIAFSRIFITLRAKWPTLPTAVFSRYEKIALKSSARTIS